MQTGAIVRLNAGCVFPNEFIETVLKNNTKGWGVAAIVEEDGQKKLMINSGDDPLDLEFIQSAVKEYNKFPMTWYFCNSDAAINIADVPPYILIGDGNDPKLVGFVEGNCPGYANKDSSHPPEHFYTDKLLIPKLMNIAEMVDEDFPKLLSQLEKPLFKTELLKDFVSRGVITLIADTGAVFDYYLPPLSEYKWGWTSNNYGYAIAKAEEPKVVAAEPEKKKLFPNKSTVREKHVPEAIKEVVTPPKSEGATVLHNITVKKWKPAGTLSRKDRKDAYTQMIGYAPPGWEKDVTVEVYYGPDNKLMTFAQVKRLGLEAAKLPKLNNPRHKGDNRDNKDTEAHIVEAHEDRDHVTAGGKQVAAEILPIMPPKSREFVKNILADVRVQKKIAENAVAIMDPNKMGAFEVKHPDFPAQLGMKSIDDFTMIEYEEFLRLAEDKHVAANLMFTFRNIIVGQRAKLGKHAAKVEAATPIPETETAVKRPSLFPKKAVA